MLVTSWEINLFLAFIIGIFILYKYSTRKFNYWKVRGVPFFPPVPLIGNVMNVLSLREKFGDYLKRLYDQVDAPYFGIFTFDEPALVIKSPELIKDILIKNSNIFIDRQFASRSRDELLKNMMFFQKGQEWKETRSKVSPAFTSTKLKAMCDLLNPYGRKMVEHIKLRNGMVNIKSVISSYVADGISKCLFGIEAYCLDDKKSEFQIMVEGLDEGNTLTYLSQLISLFKPNMLDWFKLPLARGDVVDYFANVFHEVLKGREASNIRINDFADTIADMKRNPEFRKDFNFEGRKMLSQPFMLFAAGHGTTASTLVFCLYELARNIEIQDKLRKEILTVLVKNDGAINFDTLNEMSYLEMVINETMRKYPPLPFLDRRCNVNYKLPDTELTVEKGTPVFIPLVAVHMDKNYFPEPERFQPERFEEKATAFFPFGQGPRFCIGERFGRTNLKMGLAHILSNFEFETTPETPKNPIVSTPPIFYLAEDVHLNFRPITTE